MSTKTLTNRILGAAILPVLVSPVMPQKPDFTAQFLANHTRHISSEHGIHIFHVPSKSAAGGHYRVRLSPYGNHCNCAAHSSNCCHMVAGRVVLERLQELQVLQAEMYGLRSELSHFEAIQADEIGHNRNRERLVGNIEQLELDVEDCDKRIKAHIERRAYVSNPTTGAFLIWLEGEERPHTVINGEDGSESCTCHETGCIHRQIADLELAQAGAKYLCEESRKLVYKRYARFEFENGLDLIDMGEKPITRKAIEQYLEEKNAHTQNQSN